MQKQYENEEDQEDYVQTMPTEENMQNDEKYPSHMEQSNKSQEERIAELEAKVEELEACKEKMETKEEPIEQNNTIPEVKRNGLTEEHIKQYGLEMPNKRHHKPKPPEQPEVVQQPAQQPQSSPQLSGFFG